MTRKEFLFSSAAVAAMPLIGNANAKTEAAKCNPKSKVFAFNEAEFQKGLEYNRIIMTHTTNIDELINRHVVGEYKSECTLLRTKRGCDCHDVVRFEKEIPMDYTGSWIGMSCFGYEAKAFLNKIGFFGDATGKKKTYGILNEPNLNPFIHVNEHGGKRRWEDKGFYGIVGDLISAVSELRNQIGEENFHPDKDKFTIGLSLGKDCYLNTVNKYGFSVRRFIAETWKNCRIAVIPEFDYAYDRQNVFYVIADNSDSRFSPIENVVCCDDAENPINVLSVDKNKGTVRLGFACSGVQVPYPERVVRYYGI